MPARSTAAFSTSASRSTGCQPASAPFFLPTGVRTASTIRASRMVSSAPYLPTGNILDSKPRAGVRQSVPVPQGDS